MYVCMYVCMCKYVCMYVCVCVYLIVYMKWALLLGIYWAVCQRNIHTKAFIMFTVLLLLEMCYLNCLLCRQFLSKAAVCFSHL